MKVLGKKAQRRKSDPNTIHELIGMLYGAAVDPKRWPVFVQRLAEVTSEGFASGLTREFGVGQAVPGLILLRSSGMPRDGFEELARVLGKHVQRALEVQRRLREAEAHLTGLQGCLDQMFMGLILLDERLLVRFANASARQILDRKDGLYLYQGMLATQNKREGQALNQMLHDLMRHRKSEVQQAGGISFRIPRSSGKQALTLVLCRACRPSEPGDKQSSLAVFLTDPERSIFPSREILEQVYGFTGAESLLAAQLMQGKSLEEGAHALGISVNTARTHLKRILQKTQTSRQADLIRLLHTGPASLAL